MCRNQMSVSDVWKFKGGNNMNGLAIFENPKFGKVRTLERDGEPWFVGKDVAAALGYSNTKDALIKHVDDEDERLVQRSEIATIENHIPKSVLPMNFVNKFLAQ